MDNLEGASRVRKDKRSVGFSLLKQGHRGTRWAEVHIGMSEQGRLPFPGVKYRESVPQAGESLEETPAAPASPPSPRTSAGSWKAGWRQPRVLTWWLQSPGRDPGQLRTLTLWERAKGRGRNRPASGQSLESP